MLASLKIYFLEDDLKNRKEMQASNFVLNRINIEKWKRRSKDFYFFGLI